MARRSVFAPAPAPAGTAASPAACSWLGLLVPKGTPKQVVTALNREAAKAPADPQLRAKLETLGTVPVGSSPQVFHRMLDEEYQASKALVHSAGLRAQ